MPTTYDPIATTTLTSSATSITFSNISGNYTDIVLVCVGTLTTAYDTSISLRFNGDTGNNYSVTYMYGTGSSATSGRNNNQSNIQAMGRLGSSTIGNAIVHIQNYSNSTTRKTVIGYGGTTANIVIGAAGIWLNTSAITSITVAPEGFSGSLASGTIVTLYGIKAA